MDKSENDSDSSGEYVDATDDPFSYSEEPESLAAASIDTDIQKIRKNKVENTLSNVKIPEINKFLVERMNPDFGILDKLLASKALSRAEIAEVGRLSTFHEQNTRLLELVTKNEKLTELFNALKDTHQEHIVNYVTAKGEYSEEYGGAWPLTERETSILDVNQESLVNLLDFSGNEIVQKLYGLNVLNQRQKEFICKQPYDYKKAGVLLDFLYRSSMSDYWKMITCLRGTNQLPAAKILFDGGALVRVHNAVTGDTEVVITTAEKDIVERIESMLSNMDLEESSRVLERLQLKLFAARAGHSVNLYILCETVDELMHLNNLLASGELQRGIEEFFNELISRSERFRVITTVSKETLEKCRMLLEVDRSQEKVSSKDILKLCELMKVEEERRPEEEQEEERIEDERSEKENMENQRDMLIERMESEYGLLDKLRKSLAVMEIADVKSNPTIFEKNKRLLELIFENNKHQDLIRALTDTRQTHLVNWVRGNGEYRVEFNLDWPLRQKEIEILEDNQENWTDLLDPCELLSLLFTKKIINKRQMEFIQSKPTTYEKNEELLNILRRCSRTAYFITIDCLRASSQDHIAEMLEGSGVVANLDANQLDETDTQIVRDLTSLLLQTPENHTRIKDKDHSKQQDERSEKENMENKRATLVERMESEFGLLDKLRKSLTAMEIAEVKSKPTTFEKNQRLLELIFENNKHQDLIRALTETRQTHLVNWVRGNGEYRVEFNLDWPLRKKEIEILEDNQDNWIDLLDPYELINLLFSKKVINKRQMDFIQSKPSTYENNEEILNILRRCSLTAYSLTVDCLHVSNQRYIAEMLEGSKGVGAKVELEENCDDDDGTATSNTAMHELPLELLDMILRKVYRHSCFIGNRLGQSTDEEIVRNMASVNYCWCIRVTRRRFKNIIWRNLQGFYRKCYKRVVVCRNMRLYLVENIQTKGLLNTLRSVDCLTDIETRLVTRGQDTSRRLSMNKEELLHVAKSLDDSRYSAFLQCLHENKQNLCARVASTGGVVVKAEIQCLNLENRKSIEQQMVETLSYFRDRTRSKPPPLLRQLKRLKGEGIEILDSLLDRNPVVWLWCHSESGLFKLQTDSELVLKLFNLGSIARPSAIVKIKTVNIDSDRFRKQVVVCPAAELVFCERLSIEGDVRVRGLTQLRNCIYVLCWSYSLSPNSIEVFADQHPFPLQQKISIDGIIEPEDIGSNEAENCLYVTDSATDRCIWKISTSDHRPTKWLTGASAEPFTLSLSIDGQLLKVRKSNPVSSLVIYGPDMVLRGTYPMPVDIHNPQHAIETPSGTFMVLHELKQEIVDANDTSGGQLWTVSELTRDAQMTIRRFVPKDNDQQLDRPTYLALDSDDQVFIVDTWAERVVHLDSELNWKRVLTKTGDALSSPLWSRRAHYDALNHRVMVVGLAAVDIYTGRKTTLD